jgi:hypothetical protein
MEKYYSLKRKRSSTGAAVGCEGAIVVTVPSAMQAGVLLALEQPRVCTTEAKHWWAYSRLNEACNVLLYPVLFLPLPGTPCTQPALCWIEPAASAAQLRRLAEIGTVRLL